MAAILDRWVPSRRLERKRQRALQQSLDSRFGDLHITAPTEGAWNQVSSDVDRGYRAGAVASGGWSPDLPLEKPLSESRLSTEKKTADDAPHKNSQRRNFTITIPLPWSSGKSNNRAPSMTNSTAMSATKKDDVPGLSPRSFMSISEPTPRSLISSPDLTSKSSFPSPNTTSQSPTTSPVVSYKPISEEYKKQPAEMAAGIKRVDSTPSLPPDRKQNVLPSNVIYKPASPDFAREITEVGMGPSPGISEREMLSCPRTASKPPPIGLPPDPRSIPLSQYPEPSIAPTGLPAAPRQSSPDPLTEPRPALIGLPAQPRLGTGRSASRGPVADPVGTTRAASRGPASDRAVTTRSCSRGPAGDMAGSTRSSSRGPASDRLPTTRSASRGPLSERSGIPANGRSSSRGPTSTRVPYRESASPDSSTGSGITSPSSPPLYNSVSNTNNANMCAPITAAESSHKTGVGSATGYYATVTQEYRRIASDVEDSEYARRRIREMEQSKKKEKRDHASHGPQQMVPDDDELW